MTHNQRRAPHRAISDDTARKLERWYAEYECLMASLPSVTAKCKELGISKPTFYDTVRRIRGERTTYTPKRRPANINALMAELETFHVESLPAVKKDSSDS